jgi:hypothetical protein
MPLQYKIFSVHSLHGIKFPKFKTFCYRGYNSKISHKVSTIFPGLKQNLGVFKFKSDHDLQTVVGRWLIIQDTESYRHEKESLFPQQEKGLSFVEDYVGCSGTAIELNMNCY